MTFIGWYLNTGAGDFSQGKVFLKTMVCLMLFFKLADSSGSNLKKEFSSKGLMINIHGLVSAYFLHS